MIWVCSTSFASEYASRTAAARPSVTPVKPDRQRDTTELCVAYLRTTTHQSPLHLT